MENDIERRSRIIANIEEMQTRIEHLKRLRREKEINNRNSSVCGNGENE